MRTFVLLAAVFAAFACGPCYAQTAPSAPVIGAQDVSEARLAAARRVVSANGSANSYAIVIDRLVPEMMHSIARAQGLSQAQADAATRLLSEEMRASSQEFLELQARVYARHLSTEDLTALADFYESPVGRRYIQSLPDITNDGFTVGQTYAREVIAPRINARVLELNRQGRL